MVGTPDNQPPDVPQEVEVLEGDAVLTVIWKDPAATGIFNGQKVPITKFQIYLTSDEVIDPEDPTEEFKNLRADRREEFTGLTNGRAYKVAVRTVSDSGASEFVEVTATPKLSDKAPGLPAIVSAEGLYEKVAVRWTAPRDPGIVKGQSAGNNRV